MARTPITADDIPDDDGYNLTDSADFATLGTGAGNGVSFAQNSAQRIYLKNDSGGAADFTVKIPTPASYTAIGVTFDDVTITVANGKTVLLKPNSLYRQTDGNIYIDCDVAGKVLVLA